MSLRLVRSASNAALWSACAARFLDEVGGHAGPARWPARMWVAHRSQRDALYALAAERGLPGWLDPPVSFFSQLPALFGIGRRPVGILTGRLLVARLAARASRRHGLRTAEGGPARAHMLDGVFSELLPEGVRPAALRDALAGLDGDDFSRRRDAWVADTYEAFLDELEARDRYDPRSIHALVAERIEAGDLVRALRGAEPLHVYGVTSLRGRRRLFAALAERDEVLASVYLPLEDEPEESEWDELADRAEVLDAPGRRAAGEESGGDPTVQPVPDALREARWVAGRIKRLLVEREVEPHEVAVIARSGRRDTRLLHRALEAAGVPATARIRTALAEVPALRAVLSLFRAGAEGWPYRLLRQVLGSPYFRVEADGAGIDLRILDHISRQRRVYGLDGWSEALERTRDLLRTDDRWKLRGRGVYEDRAEEAVPAFASFRDTVAPLARARTEAEWIALTLEVLGGGWFDFRRRLCRPAGGRWDIVRLDQRAVVRVEDLLREWKGLLADGSAVGTPEPFDAAEWRDRLRRLLEANEIALSTPQRTGVQVVEAHEAALTPYRHTFLVHANDGEFPRATRPASVFSEEERLRLRELGLPLADRDLASRRERTLWRAVTGGESVTITYRTTDANGVPRLPSLMAPDHDPATEIPRTLEGGRRVEGAEDGGTDPLGPISEEEHRRSEVRRLARLRAGGDGSPFATPEPPWIRHAVLAAFAEELRAGSLDQAAGVRAELAVRQTDGAPAPAGADEGGSAAVFGVERPLSLRPHPWNGELRDPVVLAWLEERFGDDYAWSASQLQAYGVRPFDFFLDRVLRIGDVEEAEEETSPLAFGSVVHTLLERFYREALDRFTALPEALEGEAEALYGRIFEEACREAEADADRWLGLPIHWSVKRQDIHRVVREFLAEELPRLRRWNDVPILLEHEFGWPGAASGPVLIEGQDVRGRPAHLALRGRIDRVDRKGGEGGPLKVIDYKSGGYPGKTGYEDGSTLQTALYIRALEALGHEGVREAVFRSVRGRTWDGSALKRERAEQVIRFALAIPARVRAGLFEAVQARSGDIADWQPGLEVTRSTARLESGSRFDLLRPPAADHA